MTVKNQVLVAVACILFPCLSFGGGAMSLHEAIRNLATRDPIKATAAAKVLYHAGEAAFPYLISAFGDESPCGALCGSNVLESQVVYESLPLANSKNLESSRTVHEVALYLIVAIQRGDYYFARSCDVRVNVSSRENLDLALGELAILYVKRSCGLAGFTESEVNAILERHGISFD